MNLYFRLFRVMLVAFLAHFRKRWSPVEGARTLWFRTWPTDLDMNLHMNNGRFLAIMDLGRLDLTARIGMIGPMWRRDWIPIVASVEIEYLRPLKPWKVFTLETRIAGWDERFFIFEHRFLAGRGNKMKPMAVAKVRGCLRNRAGAVTTKEVFDALTEIRHDLKGQIPEPKVRTMDGVELDVPRRRS